jgi:hypothetical protein
MRIRLFILLFLSLTLRQSYSQENRALCMKVVGEMLNTINTMQTVTYNLEIGERFGKKMNKASSQVKLNVNPRKIYIKIPSSGAELLWLSGKNNGNALVNPNAFPYINLNLDINGSLLRGDQHHTINELGFSYFASLISIYVLQSKNDIDKYFHYEGEGTWNGRPCHRITIENPDFKFVPYTVKEGETPITIARKLHVGEYMILERNNLKDYGRLKAGKIIQVPTSYAKRTELMIDKVWKVAVNQKIYDDLGLYESYEYSNIILNKPIPDEEFSKDYKGYNF